MPRAQYVLKRPGQPEAGGRGEVIIDPAFVMLRPEHGEPLTVPHEQVLALSGEDYQLALTLEGGASLLLSRLGQMHGDLFLQMVTARNERWEKGLFLHGVRLVDTFTAVVESDTGAVSAEVRLYEDRLSVLPETEDPFGLPYALAREVDFDADSYRVSISTDGVPVVFGMLKQRTTEFARLLGDLIAASRARTASLLAKHLPGLPGTALSELSTVMGDGIAARREDIERLAPGAWERLEGLVICNEELRETYGFLAAQSQAPDLALGIKQRRGTGEEGPAAVPVSEEPDAAADDGGDGQALVTWFFCPIRRGDAGFVAQEITSESGHATYFFRATNDDWKTVLSRLNRAMLSLNFKRRPIYEESDSAGYGFAVRHLPYLRDLRAAFAGRAIHTDVEEWKASVERILGE